MAQFENRRKVFHFFNLSRMTMNKRTNESHEFMLNKRIKFDEDGQKVQEDIPTKDTTQESTIEVVSKEELKRLRKAKQREAAALWNASLEKLKEKELKLKTASLDYLETFVKNKDKWKFQKMLQIWILQHMWFERHLNDAQFKQAIKYMHNMSSNAKQETVQDAKEILRDESNYSNITIKRAKKIVKLF